ncbi:hypothetical protein WJX73_002548 [Symbiochloris irregularis]|uniref:Uncharacterized protein n=1 Tax=Symbiochloris irregularis TaxID=706552 RepID=A0AAW1P6X7_9CHLO
MDAADAESQTSSRKLSSVRRGPVRQARQAASVGNRGARERAPNQLSWRLPGHNSSLCAHFRKTFTRGMSATVDQLDDPLVGDRRLRHLAELQTAVLAQRRLSADFSDEKKYAGVVSLHTHIAQHNLEQPWETVLQIHKDMVARAGLSLSQRVKMGQAAAGHSASMEKIHGARMKLLAALIQAQHVDTDGPPMPRVAIAMAQTKSLLAELQALQTAEERARYELWHVIICSQEMDSQQLARIQLTRNGAILPDLSILARLILDSLEPNPDATQPSLPGLEGPPQKQEALQEDEAPLTQPAQAAWALLLMALR